MKPATLVLLRDGFLLLPRLLGAGLRLFVDRALGRPPRRLEKLTRVDWLAGTLGLDPRQIESARIEPVHSGTATRSRLRIRYAGDPAPPPGPTSLFVKSSPPDFAAALFGLLFDLGGNEVSFYREIRPAVQVGAPAVHHCEGDSRSYAMLLEDLAESGCEFRDLSSRCSVEEARSVLTTLARLHAEFWQSERFEGDLAWVHRFETHRERRLTNVLRRLCAPICFEKFGHALPAGIAEIAPELLARYPRLEEEWAREPRTLIHGDAHLGNMYFRDGVAGLLDWQVHQRGQGMRDVAYFLINSVTEELRLAHQEALIAHYLATLRERGVRLDADAAWRQYRLQSVYAWIAAVVTAPSKFQEERVVLAGLTRSSKAVLDLDAIGVIRTL